MNRSAFILILSFALLSCDKYEFVPYDNSEASVYKAYEYGTTVSAELSVPANGLQEGQYLFIEKNSFLPNQEVVYQLQGYKAISSYYTFESNFTALALSSPLKIKLTGFSNYSKVRFYEITNNGSSISESILNTDQWNIINPIEIDTISSDKHITTSIIDLDKIYVLGFTY